MIRWDDSRKDEDRSPEDQFFGDLMQLILEMEAKELLAKIEDGKARGDTAEIDALIERFDERFHQILDKYFPKRNSEESEEEG